MYHVIILCTEYCVMVPRTVYNNCIDMYIVVSRDGLTWVPDAERPRQKGRPLLHTQCKPNCGSRGTVVKVDNGVSRRRGALQAVGPV